MTFFNKEWPYLLYFNELGVLIHAEADVAIAELSVIEHKVRQLQSMAIVMETVETFVKF